MNEDFGEALANVCSLYGEDQGRDEETRRTGSLSSWLQTIA